MEKKLKVLKKKEKCRKMRGKFLYLRKILFPDEQHVIQFISVAVIDPGIIILFVDYVWGEILNIPLAYLLIESAVISLWVLRAFRREKLLEEMELDRTGSIIQKIEELKEMGSSNHTSE